MGTRFELVLEAGACDLTAAGEAALEEIEEWHRRLSRFAADSLVSHITRTAAVAAVRLDRETFELFADALAVWRDSGGAFDIAVAPLMADHGYPPSAVRVTTGHATEREPGAAPARSEAIVLDPGAWTIRFSRPGISIDLGAIAKGHALDCAGALLREHGVTSALLHGGTSSVLAIGGAAGGEGWRVALAPGAGATVVTLRDRALALSEPSSQATPDRPGHIMDPRSASPVTRRGRVAVVGPSARRADAWATALSVLGCVPPAFPPDYRAFFEPEVTA
jgi:thiamine biosynthesis lipoprotein